MNIDHGVLIPHTGDSLMGRTEKWSRTCVTTVQHTGPGWVARSLFTSTSPYLSALCLTSKRRSWEKLHSQADRALPL